MQNADKLTRLLSRIIRKNEPELADFNVVYRADPKLRRAVVSITEKRLYIPRSWNKIEVILEGLAPLIKKARLQMEMDAVAMDTKVSGAGISLDRAILFLESTSPKHLESILSEFGFVRDETLKEAYERGCDDQQIADLEYNEQGE